MRIRFSLAALALATAWAVPAALAREPQGQEFSAGPVPTIADEAAPAGEGQPAAAAPQAVLATGGWDGMTPPWHAGYYHTMFGRPVPLVVPPTATYQTNWGWGIGNTRVTPIYPQFSGPYAGYAYEGMERWQPMPSWPTDTLQFGAYYVRGPFGDNNGNGQGYPAQAYPPAGHHGARHGLFRRRAVPCAQGYSNAAPQGTSHPTSGEKAKPTTPEAVPPGASMRLRNPYRQPVLSELKMKF